MLGAEEMAQVISQLREGLSGQKLSPIVANSS